MNSRTPSLKSESGGLQEQVKKLQEQLAQKQQELIAQRQTTPSPLPDGAVPKVYNLQYMQPKTMASTLLQVFGDGRLRISVVEGANAIIVAGGDPDLPKVDALIKELDQLAKKEPVPDRATTLQLRFIWLAGDLPEGVGTMPDPRTISIDAFNAVGQMGFRSTPRVLCQHVISVAKSKSGSAPFRFQVPVGFGDNSIEFTGEGSVSSDVVYRLEMQLAASIRKPNITSYRISTVSGSIALPSRHYVVIGTSDLMFPEDKPRSYPTAFVVYLEEAITYAK